jgi:hypothetical protein
MFWNFVVNSLYYVPLDYHFLSGILRMLIIWSIVDLLRRNACWEARMISFPYGVNRRREMWDKMLYVLSVDNTDMSQ